MKDNKVPMWLNICCVLSVAIASYVTLFGKGGYLHNDEIEVVCGYEVTKSDCDDFRKEVNSMPRY